MIAVCIRKFLLQGTNASPVRLYRILFSAFNCAEVGMFERLTAGNLNRKLFLLFCSTIFSSVLLFAQTREQMEKHEKSYFPGTLFRNQESKPTKVFTDNCPKFDSQACSYNMQVSENCQVENTIPLGTIAARQFFLVRYRRTIAVHEASKCETDEALVLESVGQELSRPVWYDATERRFTFLENVSLHHSKKHSFLVINYCVNGAGGCWQSAYIWSGDQWGMLKHDQTWGDVYNNIPDGYWTQKSPPIDFRKLRWEQNIVSEASANCCPPGMIQFELEIVNNELSVRSYNFVFESGP